MPSLACIHTTVDPRLRTVRLDRTCIRDVQGRRFVRTRDIWCRQIERFGTVSASRVRRWAVGGASVGGTSVGGASIGASVGGVGGTYFEGSAINPAINPAMY